MMAAVFLMQPLGHLLAYVVGFAVLLTVGGNAGLAAESDPLAAAQVVDKIWRWVLLFGTIPALIAICFRSSIPESPRFTLDVARNAESAQKDVRKFYEPQSLGSFHHRSQWLQVDLEDIYKNLYSRESNMDDYSIPNKDDDIIEVKAVGGCDFDDQRWDHFSRTALFEYFWKQGNIKWLLATSLCWFLLDFAFYGLGTNNPRILAQIWPSTVEESALSIYEVLYQDSIRSIITISIGSLTGSIILIKIIDYIPRRSWLVWSFVGMTLLFAFVGVSHFWAVNPNSFSVILYILCQLLFNLGPNTLTFILPAEMFPTRYRATCYGISAAAGKLGSVAVQLFLTYTDIAHPSTKAIPWALLMFSLAMALGAVFAWAWIPEVQDVGGTEAKRWIGWRGRGNVVPSKTLEELAIGRIGFIDERRMLGFRKKMAQLLNWMATWIKDS
jgi:MFS transporter, PHS family, inorganic phosphate transporter